jgi:endoglucanase
VTTTESRGRLNGRLWLALLLLLAPMTGGRAEGDRAVRARPLLFGASTHGGVWQGMAPVRELEARLERRLDIIHWFMNWDHAWDPELLERAAQQGRTPLISWQPHTQPVAQIAVGAYDAYILDWAEGVRAFGRPVYLRPFPEMNGDWVGWNGDPEGLVLAWRRTAQLFERAGADNVRWVWSPNLTDSPRTAENRMEAYYPGSDVVDVLALDGYNWGVTREWSAWRSFEEIFAEPYRRVTALGPQPLWLAELGSTDQGGDKAAWVRDMLASTAFARLEAIVWFDHVGNNDWRIGHDPEVVAAFREGLARLSSTAR